MDVQLEAEIAELAGRLRESRYTVAFTGAGMSSESGIPDFRGPAGIWKKMRPIELSEFLADPAARPDLAAGGARSRTGPGCATPSPMPATGP